MINLRNYNAGRNNGVWDKIRQQKSGEKWEINFGMFL